MEYIGTKALVPASRIVRLIHNVVVRKREDQTPSGGAANVADFEGWLGSPTLRDVGDPKAKVTSLARHY